jgi:hypothetical protein
VVALSLIALPAQAAGTVYIEKVYYSSPGAGDGSNFRLNAEYAVIRKTAAHKSTRSACASNSGRTAGAG